MDRGLALVPAAALAVVVAVVAAPWLIGCAGAEHGLECRAPPDGRWIACKVYMVPGR